MQQTWTTECSDEDITEAKSTTTAKKFDAGKPQWHLLPWDALESVVRVFEFGATKYGEFNWQLGFDTNNRWYNAGARHLFALFKGEKLDPESGLPHEAHIIANMLFVLWFDKQSQHSEAQ